MTNFENAFQQLNPMVTVDNDYFYTLTPEACEAERASALEYEIQKRKTYLKDIKADKKKSALSFSIIEKVINRTYDFQNWYNIHTKHLLSKLPVHVGDRIFSMSIVSSSFTGKQSPCGKQREILFHMETIRVTQREQFFLEKNYHILYYNQEKNQMAIIKQTDPMMMIIVFSRFTEYNMGKDIIRKLYTLRNEEQKTMENVSLYHPLTIPSSPMLNYDIFILN